VFYCPRCVEPLVPGRVSEGKLWECGTCHGRLISLYALRWVSQEDAVNQLWKTVIQRHHPGPLPCPVCQHFMFEQPLPASAGAPEVDACRSCHMLWFDGGELDQLPKWRPPNPNRLHSLPQAARERLALEQVKKIRTDAERATGDEMPSEAWQVAAGFLGMPVEYDNPSSGRTWLTWGVAVMCVLMFLGSLAAGLEKTIWRWGFIPAEPFRQFGLTSLTSFFLHGDWWHLLGNLYFLLIFGDNVEDALRPKRFILLLLAATLVGDVLHALGDPRSDIPCVGASGGISGVIAFYACRFPRARLGMLFRYFLYFRWFSFPAWGGLVMWGLLQAFLVYLQTQGYSNISALAHLGGAAVGVAFWWWSRNDPATT
jgi:membrane associated rhomboid family serine protease